MTHTEQLIEQHIREYESRLRHLDELMAQAREKGASPESHEELAEAQEQRQALAGEVETLKERREQGEIEEIRKAGPMGVWDVIAQKLEHLIERMEK